MTMIRAATCGKFEAKISEMERWDGTGNVMERWDGTGDVMERWDWPGDVEAMEVVYKAAKQQDDVFASVWV